MCAASPTRKMRPLLKLLQQRAWNRYTALRSICSSRESTHGATSLAMFSGHSICSRVSPGRSMNSQRSRPPGAGICGAGRSGSQRNST
ncbi:hypothetical protein FQZ97_981230 [compost metagenome]